MTTPEPTDRGPMPPSGAGQPPVPGRWPDPGDNPAPADWSTPATVAESPPIGGLLSGPGDPDPRPGPGEPVEAVPPPGPGRRDPRPWVVLAVAVLFLVSCYALAGLAIAAWADDALDIVRDRSQGAVDLGQPVRDGAIEFRVHGIDCGVTRIGDPLVSQTAAGQYCVVELDVRNLGGQPVILADTPHEAYGPRGERYLADPGAGLLANADQPAFFTELGPGDQARGTVVYDIPPTSRIVRLRLHEAAGSRGALVRV